MVRHTQHHQFPVPESGDSDYHETFDRMIDSIDLEVILKGTIENRPVAGIEGRWYLSTNESPPTIYYDTGSQWTSPATFGDPPDNIARRDRDQTITGQWEFEETIQGDIDGEAEYANHGADAEHADNARMIAGYTEDDFARTGRDETFTGIVQFEDRVTMNGLRVQNGPLELPRYSGSDPTNVAGDIWFREDRQP